MACVNNIYPWVKAINTNEAHPFLNIIGHGAIHSKQSRSPWFFYTHYKKQMILQNDNLGERFKNSFELVATVKPGNVNAFDRNMLTIHESDGKRCSFPPAEFVCSVSMSNNNGNSNGEHVQ